MAERTDWQSGQFERIDRLAGWIDWFSTRGDITCVQVGNRSTENPTLPIVRFCLVYVQLPDIQYLITKYNTELGALSLVSEIHALACAFSLTHFCVSLIYIEDFLHM